MIWWPKQTPTNRTLFCSKRIFLVKSTSLRIQMSSSKELKPVLVATLAF
jgi:hypothetical protein